MSQLESAFEPILIIVTSKDEDIRI